MMIDLYGYYTNFCGPIYATIPRCARQIVIQTDVIHTPVQYRIEKYNHRVKYGLEITDAFGLLRIPQTDQPFFSPWAGHYRISAINTIDQTPVWFSSNLGLHPEIFINVEYSDEYTGSGDYFVNQDIIYFCCTHTLIDCGVCTPPDSLNFKN